MCGHPLRGLWSLSPVTQGLWDQRKQGRGPAGRLPPLVAPAQDSHSRPLSTTLPPGHPLTGHCSWPGSAWMPLWSGAFVTLLTRRYLSPYPPRSTCKPPLPLPPFCPLLSHQLSFPHSPPSDVPTLSSPLRPSLHLVTLP